MKDYSEIYEKYDRYAETIPYMDQFGYPHERIEFHGDLAKNELDKESFLIAVIYSRIKDRMNRPEGSELIEIAEDIAKTLKYNKLTS